MKAAGRAMKAARPGEQAVGVGRHDPSNQDGGSGNQNGGSGNQDGNDLQLPAKVEPENAGDR